MDNDSTALQNAISVLRQQYGEQLAGPRQRTEAQMLQTLQQQLGLDGAAAEHVVKKLYDSGQLTYVAGSDSGSEDGTDTEDTPSDTGPVISMPSTQSADGGAPLITTVSPAMLMGIVNEEGGDVGSYVTEDNDEPGMGDVGIADTNIEAAPTKGTTGGRGDMEGMQGYWRIG